MAWQEGGKAPKNEQEEGRESGGYRVGGAETSTLTMGRRAKGVTLLSTSRSVLLMAAIVIYWVTRQDVAQEMERN